MIGRRSLSFGSGRSPVAMHGDLVHSAILGWSHPHVADTLLKEHTDTVQNPHQKQWTCPHAESLWSSGCLAQASSGKRQKKAGPSMPCL